MFNETYYQELSSEMIGLWGGENYVLKRKVVSWVSKLTSALSLLGSIYISFDLLKKEANRNNQKLPKLFNQLLLGLSCSDAISSLAILVGTWAMPADGIDANFFVGSSGNVTSCTFQGIGVMVGAVSANSFVMFISIHHMLVSRYGISINLLEKIHRIFLLLAPFISMAFGISYLVDDAIVPLGLYCIPGGIYPYFCRYSDPSREEECIIREPKLRGAHTSFLIHFFICLLSVFTSMVLIITDTKNRPHRYPLRFDDAQDDALSRKVILRASQYIAISLCMFISIIMNIILPKTWISGLILAATYPLQGFLNALIYSRKFEVLEQLWSRRTIISFNRSQHWNQNEDSSSNKAFNEMAKYKSESENLEDVEVEHKTKIGDDTTSI